MRSLTSFRQLHVKLCSFIYLPNYNTMENIFTYRHTENTIIERDDFISFISRCNTVYREFFDTNLKRIKEWNFYSSTNGTMFTFLWGKDCRIFNLQIGWNIKILQQGILFVLLFGVDITKWLRSSSIQRYKDLENTGSWKGNMRHNDFYNIIIKYNNYRETSCHRRNKPRKHGPSLP